MNFRYFISLLIVMVLFIQCDVLDVDRDKIFVRAEIVENKLIIQNYNLFPIYLVAMDLEFASRIDWFPVESEENKVPAIRKRTFSTEFIGGFEPDNKIIIYTWDKLGLYWDSLTIEPPYK